MAPNLGTEGAGAPPRPQGKKWPSVVSLQWKRIDAESFSKSTICMVSFSFQSILKILKIPNGFRIILLLKV